VIGGLAESNSFMIGLTPLISGNLIYCFSSPLYFLSLFLLLTGVAMRGYFICAATSFLLISGNDIGVAGFLGSCSEDFFLGVPFDLGFGIIGGYSRGFILRIF